MGGFDTVVGSIFSFFILISVFVGIFVIYQSQIVEQASLLSAAEENSFITSIRTDYQLGSVFSISGRTYLEIHNSGSDTLNFKRGENDCFNFFVNGNFISLNNYKIKGDGPLTAIYSVIEPSTSSYAIINNDININEHNSFVSVSCSGLRRTLDLNSGDFDWAYPSWKNRKEITIENVNDNSLVEYQVPINLDLSNIDFSTVKREEVRFGYSIRENIILDLTFDTYSQELKDFSRYDHEVFLGITSSPSSDDPSFNNEGVLFSALDFDGINDRVYVNVGDSVIADKELSFSFWFKWNEEGDDIQNLFYDPESGTELYIINDGGSNQARLGLNLEVLSSDLIGNITLNSNWNNVIGTYDGNQVNLYLNSRLIGSEVVNGDLSFDISNFFIGARSSENYFNGSIDEFKVFNIGLSNLEVNKLYRNNLFYRDLDFYIANWNIIEEKALIYAKIPFIGAQDNITIYMYYDNPSNTNTFSDIESTFSYKVPRTVGYVVSDRIASTNGLNVMSLYDSNTISIGSSNLNLDKFSSSVIDSSSLSLSTPIELSRLAQIEGEGTGTDIIVPISWASTEFYYSGLRASDDYVCMLSPFGVSNVDILNNGVIVDTISVNTFGNCYINSTSTSANFGLESDLPILVSYFGDLSQDSFVFYPATSENLYSVPSRDLRIASGFDGSNIIIRKSDSGLNLVTLSSYGQASPTGTSSSQGLGSAFMLETDNKIGAIQQNDGDGLESSVFVPRKEFGKFFGSSNSAQYIALVSKSANANCRLYTNSTSIATQPTAIEGTSGVYKYGFGLGSSDLIVSNPWIVECDEPVWGYYERDFSNAETNMFGHVQMRQYVYPEPVVTIS